MEAVCSAHVFPVRILMMSMERTNLVHAFFYLCPNGLKELAMKIVDVPVIIFENDTSCGMIPRFEDEQYNIKRNIRKHYYESGNRACR